MNVNTINYTLLSNLLSLWSKRAGVKGNDEFIYDENYNPELMDFPSELLPFVNHPKYIELDHAHQSEVLTHIWLGYNYNVNVFEDKVTNPVINWIIDDEFDIPNNFCVKQLLRNTLIDEYYHLAIHSSAMEATINVRNIHHFKPMPDTIFYSQLKNAQSTVSEDWQKKIIQLVWSVVSEVSVNAYLELLSNNTSIQPMHRRLAYVHNRDEHSHNKIMIEVCKIIYINFDKKKKAFFEKYLPVALNAFILHDFRMYEKIFFDLNLPNGYEIIGDAKNTACGEKQIKDLSGIRNLISALDLKAENIGIELL